MLTELEMIKVDEHRIFFEVQVDYNCILILKFQAECKPSSEVVLLPTKRFQRCNENFVTVNTTPVIVMMIYAKALTASSIAMITPAIQ